MSHRRLWLLWHTSLQADLSTHFVICSTFSFICVMCAALQKQIDDKLSATKAFEESTSRCDVTAKELHQQLKRARDNCERWKKREFECWDVFFCFPSINHHLKEGLLVGLKRIRILSNPSPNWVIETNTEYPRIPLGTYSTFTYYGSLEIEKLLKIFWGQIGSSQEAEAGECDFDSFCLAHSLGNFLAQTWCHFGAIIFRAIWPG